jgi:BlaI family transcriptional regulator, penicillinase repressor
MKDTPKISEAEWEIMKVLWDDSPKSANEVAEAVSKRKDWNYLTVRTLLYRLVKKGILKADTSTKLILFSPTVSKDECALSESQSFLHRVFNGEKSPLLAHLVKHEILTSDDLKELKKILSKKTV